MSNDNPTTNKKKHQAENEPIKCHVYVEPGVQIDVVEYLKNQHNSERAEDKASSNKQLWWTKAAVFLVFLYTLFTSWEVKISKDTFNFVNRPYVGVSGIGIKYPTKDEKGVVQFLDRPTTASTSLSFNVEIKNYGPVPGNNYTSQWKVLVGGIENPGPGVEVPTIIFPGESLFKMAQVGEKDYPDVMNGTKELAIETTIYYDGPSGHYKQCSKHKFLADINGFLDLGTACPAPK
jgi:hypothetical protein